MNKTTSRIAIWSTLLLISMLLLGACKPINAQFELKIQTPTPTSTPIPALGERIAQKVNGWQKDFADPAIAIGKLVLTILLLLVVVYLIFYLFYSAKVRWLIEKFRDDRTIIDEFENTLGEGSDNLTKMVCALVAEGLREHIKETGVLGYLFADKRAPQHPVPLFKSRFEYKADFYTLNTNFHVFEKVSNKSMDNFLKELTPQLQNSELKFLVLLVRWLFPTPGTKVGGHLLKLGPSPQNHGLVVELSDLGSEETLQTHTFWGKVVSPQNQKFASCPSPNGALDSKLLAGIYLNLGKYFIFLAQFDKAISAIEEGLKQDPASKALVDSHLDAVNKQMKEQQVRAFYDLGAKFQALKLLPQAREYYMRALTFKQGSVGDREILLALYGSDSLIERAQAYYFLANTCMEYHLRMEAESFFRSAVESDPTNGQYRQSLEVHLSDTACTYKQIGLLFEVLGKYDEAKIHLTNALEKSPDDQAIATALARVAGKKQFEEGTKEAEYKLGQIYEAKGLYDTAKTHFEEAIKKDPAYKDAITALECVLGREDAQTYSDLTNDVALWIGCHICAKKLLKMQSMYKQNPRLIAEPLNYLGLLFSNLSVYEDAFIQFKKATQIDEQWYLPYLNLGDAYSFAGRQSESIREYNMALYKAPTVDNEEIIQTIKLARACSYWLSDDKDKATRDVREIEQTPQSSNVKYVLACFYSIVGEIPIALGWLEKALEDKSLKKALGDWVWKDPDLENIRGEDEFRRLVSAQPLL